MALCELLPAPVPSGQCLAVHRLGILPALSARGGAAAAACLLSLELPDALHCDASAAAIHAACDLGQRAASVQVWRVLRPSDRPAAELLRHDRSPTLGLQHRKVTAHWSCICALLLCCSTTVVCAHGALDALNILCGPDNLVVLLEGILLAAQEGPHARPAAEQTADDLFAPHCLCGPHFKASYLVDAEPHPVLGAPVEQRRSSPQRGWQPGCLYTRGLTPVAAIRAAPRSALPRDC
mmetsp:Transcript_74795/g.206219  ORF Transcript_74795/g.206219 Transcript_74795/m.206219 type:complete len:237 (-) Transcript_74795:1118-1828(-)